MGFNHKECPRGFGPDRCYPLANVVGTHEDGQQTFVCVGYNAKGTRAVHQDRFRHCWKSCDGIDIRQDMDRRDMLDTVSTLAQALSFDENNRVNADATDEQMNDMDLIALERSYEEAE